MGRAAVDNPFTPGFGNLPRVFTGRRSELADLELMVERLGAGIYEQPRLVTGDRGVGKTALLRELEDEQRAAGRWVARASATRGDALIGRVCARLADVLDEDLAARLSRSALAALRRLGGVEVGPRGVRVELTNPPAAGEDRADALGGLLAETGALARERGTVLVLLVDEAQNCNRAALGDLFHALQEATTRTVTERDPVSGATLRHALPVGVVVAGLPGLVAQLSRSGSTFGERSKPVPLDVLGEADMREGLQAFARAGGAVFDADALEAVMAASGGYPYFLHVIGSHVWNAGDGDVITLAEARAGITAARAYLDAFYEERLRPLGDRQRAYLDAAAHLDPAERTSGRIAAELDTTSDRLASTWQSLIERHALLRPAGGRGRLAFTLPGLADYLRRS